MISIKAEKRKDLGKKGTKLRKRGILPAVVYGPEVENENIQMDVKEFNEFYEEAGGSTLVSLKVGDKEYLVLVQEVKNDPLTGEPTHVDFYQPILTEEVEATVELIFEGEAPAVKDLGGTLVKEFQEIEVKALPQNLPHEIVVNVEGLKTFEDEILVKDLKVADNVTILRDPEDLVAIVTPAEDIEAELEKPIAEAEAEVKVEGEEDKDKEGEGEETKEEIKEETKDDKK